MTIFKHCSKISQICKIISNNFEDVLLEQIIIDFCSHIVTFVHILSSFNEKITVIAKINIVIFMV